MEQNLFRKTMWDTAGKAGLVLALITTVYMFMTQGMAHAEIPAFLNSILSFLLWAAKFIGCIWVMKLFMRRFAIDIPAASGNDTFRLGILMSILSALVYAGVSFANVAFISPDLFAEQMDAIMQQMAPMMDSNTLDQMNRTMENLPQITFISNLAYCFLYGLVLSFILSRNIPVKDPFADYKPDEQ